MVACLSATKLNAQYRKNFAIRDTVILDSRIILQQSLHITANEKTLIDDRDYFLLSDFKTLVFKNKPTGDSFTATFSVLPESLIKQRYLNKIFFGSTIPNPLVGDPYAKNNNARDGDELRTDGVLLRGISFGNSQDLVLNSNLNLRLGGTVGKDIKIEGAITDQEYPFQPDGTTSTLQDFDRIYMKISKADKLAVLLGDYYFQNKPVFWFSKYSKKNRGMQITGTDTLNKGILSWEASGALARGRFSRNEIPGTEGLQGPYRLTGSRNEQFIIIISGTEQIYLDGKKMERGLQADYIIDYNSGEITFTPKHIITAFSRIVAEFQYSDRFYTRTVTGANLSYQSSRWSHAVNVYSEQDAKSQPIQQNLDYFDSSRMLTSREILMQAGDNKALAVISEVKALESFSANQPNYYVKDSAGIKMYVYASVKDSTKKYYQVNFNYVGKGLGNYVVSATTANGKVFVWTKDQAGDYEPITQIQAPNRLTLIESQTGYKNNNFKASFNAAYSNNDQNTLSASGDNNNNGYGLFLKLNDNSTLKKFSSGNTLKLLNDFNAEYTSNNFSTVERYRSVEFNRDFQRSQFNVNNAYVPVKEGYATHQLGIFKDNKFNYIVKGGINQRQLLRATYLTQNFMYKYRNFSFEPAAELRSDNEKNHAQLYKAAVSFTNSNHRTQLVAQQEKSEIRNHTDTLQYASFAYKELRLSETLKYKKLSFNADASQRITDNVIVVSNELKPVLKANNLQGEIVFQNTKTSYTKIGINQRKSILLNNAGAVNTADGDHTAVRYEWNFKQFLKLFAGNVFYQTLSGREQQRQYTYFEVPAGQGFFTWVDFNSNGIQESNEFQETPFKDKARYSRVLVPTGQYIQAQISEFNGNLLTDFTRLKKWNPRFGKIQNRFTWTYNGKSVNNNFFKKLSPMFDDGQSTDILSYTGFYRNMVEFENRKNTLLVQYQLQQRGNKLLYSNGFDTRNSGLNSVLFRYIFEEKWQCKLNLEHRHNLYVSEFVPTNSYNYRLFATEPSITWQSGSKMRVSLSAKYSGKLLSWVNSPARLLEGSLQATRSISSTGIADLTFSFLNATYSGNTNSPEGYDILQGFVTGKNVRVQTNIRFNSGKNIQMVLGYDGRFNTLSPAVHVGRAEVRYLF